MRRPGFWDKVNKRPDGCWDWMGYFHPDASPKYCTRVKGRPRQYKATRYAWEQLVGPIPPKQCLVRLVCWNPKCVNPAHGELMPRSHIRQWMHVMQRPVEAADLAGEWNPHAKLTTDAVREIRSYRGVIGAVPILAELYRVSKHTVANVIIGQGWRGIRGRVGGRMPLEKLRELVQQRSTGWSTSSVSA